MSGQRRRLSPPGGGRFCMAGASTPPPAPTEPPTEPDKLNESSKLAGAGETLILDADGVRRALTRIAHEILERNRGSADLVLLGIPRRGVPLATRLAGRTKRARVVAITPYPAAASEGAIH